MKKQLVLWIPEESSKKLYEKLMAMINIKRPDLVVEIFEYPLKNYWNILRKALQLQQGPDLFFMHNEYAKELIEQRFLSAYAFTSQQKEVLARLYPLEANQTYYYDFAHLTSLMYVQEDVCIDDTSNTWEALEDTLVKEDTYRYHLGCNVNGESDAAFYMMCALQNQEMDAFEKKETNHFIQEMFKTLRISPMSKDSKEGFLLGEIACVYSWGWFAGYLNDRKIAYRVLPTPRIKNCSIIDRKNTKSSFAINNNTRNKVLANEVIYEFLSNPDIQRLFSLTRKVVPLHRALQEDPSIQNDAILLAQKEILNRIYLPKKALANDAFQASSEQMKQLYEQVK